jgi:thiol-disulfide isomerase/thioredoxin
VLGLNNDQDRRDRQDAVEFAKKSLTYPVLLDAGPAFNRYLIRGVPTTFVIDKDGKVVSRHVGFSRGTEKILEEELKRLLAPQTTSR